MRTSGLLGAYLLRRFFPAFAGALAFFVLILEIFDLFANLWRYLALDVPLGQLGRLLLLYLPTCVSLALPVALLFACSFALGSLYAGNELVVIFGSGISLGEFVRPLLLIALLLSAGRYFFEDRVALPALREKTALSREILRQGSSLSNSDVAVLAADARLVYRAEFYDDANLSLSGLTIIERDGEGAPLVRVDAASARWDGERWVLQRSRRFERVEGGWTESTSLPSRAYDEPPASFKTQDRDLAEMSVAELLQRADFQRRAGLPFAMTVAERHRRFAFSLAPLVVAFLSSALGGRFRKNVVLMSLLASLLAATGYYVIQMVSMLFAKTGLAPPAAGAWTPFVLFTVAGLVLYKTART